DLAPGDADILLQFHNPDVLWHKERLLNLAVRAVPPECSAIAWLDCDVVFERADWAGATCRALDRFALVQPFTQLFDLPREAGPDLPCILLACRKRESLAYRLCREPAPANFFCTAEISLRQGFTHGHGWAARREVLEGHGFYDVRIVGGGPKVIACAAYGRWHEAVTADTMNDRAADHYLRWARPYLGAVGPRLGFVEGGLYHLWHGELEDRRYGARHQGFRQFRFDPYTDISLDGNGCWRWNSAKPDMHEYVRNYFELRKEDG